MTGAEKKAIFDGLTVDVAEYAERHFASTNARFLVVAWIDGHAAEIGCVAMAGHPEGRDQIATALQTALTWALNPEPEA